MIHGLIIKRGDMHQELLQACIESMESDPVFRAALMEKADIAERIELICIGVLCYALNELRQEQLDLSEDCMERSVEENSCGANTTASVIKGSSPQTVGYAKPTKAVEQRFKD